jgi:hypothetical protein
MPFDRGGRSTAGQASLEYVALWGLVAVVVGAAAALTSGGLGASVAYALQRGLCAVTGSVCPAPPRAASDLPPCPVRRTSKGEAYDVSLAVVKLGGGLAVLEERDSAGRVSVTFTNTGHGALTAGIGAHFDLGGLDVGAVATGEVGIGFTAGRSWRLRSQSAADAFVARYGSDQTLLGRLGNDARRICPLCHILGWEPDVPPAPDESYLEGGGRLGAAAVAGLGARAEAGAALADALGRRRRRTGETTWYLRLDGSVAARLFVGVGLGGTAGGAALAEYATDRVGRPVELRIRLAGGRAGEMALPRGEPVPGGLQTRVPVPPFRGRGRFMETETTLDLTDPRNREAALDVLGALGPGAPSLPHRLDVLAGRLRTRGVTDLRSYRVRTTHRGADATVALGVVAGGGLSSDAQALDLTGVYTRLPGLGYLPRADCLAL